MTRLVCSSSDNGSFSIPLTKEDEKIVLNTIDFQAKYNEAIQILMNRKGFSLEENRNEALALTKFITKNEDNHIPLAWSVMRGK